MCAFADVFCALTFATNLVEASTVIPLKYPSVIYICIAVSAIAGVF